MYKPDLHVKAATIAEYAYCNDGTTQDDTTLEIEALVNEEVEAFATKVKFVIDQGHDSSGQSPIEFIDAELARRR